MRLPAPGSCGAETMSTPVTSSASTEKRRQVALEDAGYEVVRWLWAEIRNDPAIVVARVRRGFQRARRFAE